MIGTRPPRLGACLAVAAAAVSAGCLNHSNVEPDAATRLAPEVGIVFGRFEIAAPPRYDPFYVAVRDGFLVTGDGALAKVERIGDGASYRFRIPPSGEFRWDLEEGEYRVTHWKGILSDGHTDVTEAHLSLEARFTVERGRALAAGTIRFDGAALEVVPGGDDAIARFREAVPGFPGEVGSRPAAAIAVRPPVRIVRYAKPGGGDCGRAALPPERHVLRS